MNRKTATILILSFLLLTPLISSAVHSVHAEADWTNLTEGFENYNDNGWTEYDSGSDSIDITTDAHSGTYGLEISDDDYAYAEIYHDYEETPMANFTVSFWFKLEDFTLDPLDDECHFFSAQNWDYGSIILLAFDGTNDDHLTCYSCLDFQTNDLGSALSQDVWHSFSFTFIGGGTDDASAELFVDSVSEWSWSGDASDVPGLDYELAFGAVNMASSNAFVFHYDDINLSYGSMIIATLEDGENIDGYEPWVFTDWKYYTFTIDVIGGGNISDVVMYFYVETGSATVACGFRAFLNENDDWAYELATDLTDQDRNRFGDPVILQAGSVSEGTSGNYTLTYKIFFNDQCLDEWEDAVDIYCWANSTEGSEIAFQLVSEDVFFIYSKGGFTKNFTTSSVNYAGKVGGEEWCALYAYAGNSTTNEIWFRDLQHIKMLPEVQFYAGYETFNIQYEIWYSVGEGEFLPGWKIVIVPDFVSYTGIFASNIWINMSVFWYQGNGTAFEGDPGDGSGGTPYAFNSDLYMFYHGSVQTAGDIGRWRFWMDMWFNSINASSTGGGRINAYEFPMNDNADLWLRWLANNWGVKDDVDKEDTFMVDLIDADGNIMSSERIEMVKVLCRLNVAQENEGSQLIVLHNYDALDYTKSPDFPLTGIQTPVFDETKMPTVGNTGVLGAIFSMFSGIGQWLSENILFGGLNLWGNFVAFLDTIAGWLGAPHFFSDLFAWIGEGFSYVGMAAANGFELLVNFFSLFGSLLTAFVYSLGEIVGSFVSFLSNFVSFMEGGVGAAGNLWDQLGILQWLTVALVFYPLYLVILWDEKGMDAVIQQLTWIFGIAVFLYHFFEGLIQGLITMISALIESIPVAE